ncbi:MULTISPECIES: hypothetical protein [unclassified Pseudoclavibacter]|uniref:hypothetical protein n=1 Tax=unclassified Pseudoclavibacter TaxID=2615177 RepID=UPI001BA6C2A7|nr:hypothetical protein [Pseudoclavibacter sp. Marseille-Q4354]MBS3180127.1 hypothetical protein [Pseudoclavibacter sp. Marseille-Q4354]
MPHSVTPQTASETSGPDRRAMLSAAAWTVPILATAAAAPLASASTPTGISAGAFRLVGNCGVQGLIGPGFLLAADPGVALPVGTTILITGSGVASLGLVRVTGQATADVENIGTVLRRVTLTSELPADESIAVRTSLSISSAFTLTAFVILPDGYVEGGGAKPAGNVNSQQILCSAS